MHSTLSLILLAVAAVAVLLAVGLVLANGRSGRSVYDEIGRGGLLGGEDRVDGRHHPDGGGVLGLGPQPSPSARAAERDSDAERNDDAERELEVRQMLAARNERRLRRGEPALDLDAETARLLHPASRPGAEPSADLLDEVRQLVLARNIRRTRQGLPPLELDAELKRTLAELGFSVHQSATTSGRESV